MEDENLKIKMIRMEENIKFIKDKLEKVPTMDKMKLANEVLVKAIFKEADKRYAFKLSQKIIYGMCSIILISALTSITVLITR